MLVLFESGPNGKHRAAALDYSTLTVPPGTYSVWSLAPRPLGLGLGDTRTLIEPGRRHLVSLPLNSRTYVDLTIYGATPDGRARLLSSGRHAHRPDVRQLMFLTSSPDGSRANIRIITDVTPPASHTVSQNAR